MDCNFQSQRLRSFLRGQSSSSLPTSTGHQPAGCAQHPSQKHHYGCRHTCVVRLCAGTEEPTLIKAENHLKQTGESLCVMGGCFKPCSSTLLHLIKHLTLPTKITPPGDTLHPNPNGWTGSSSGLGAPQSWQGEGVPSARPEQSGEHRS